MRDELQQFSLPAGPIAAILLGMALTPLREATSAGNFIFAFVILIILFASYGGRWAALATAGVSALSLDFFLTRPYLDLRIEDKHDLYAFVGLTLCGLVSAALGSARSRQVAELERATARLDLMHAAVALLDAPGPAIERLTELLRIARDALALEGLVVRDAAGAVVAASGTAPAPRPQPEARLELIAEGRPVGRMEIWGGGARPEAHEHQALPDVARLAAVLLAPRG